jgi:hypothetical protein
MISLNNGEGAITIKSSQETFFLSYTAFTSSGSSATKFAIEIETMKLLKVINDKQSIFLLLPFLAAAAKLINDVVFVATIAISVCFVERMIEMHHPENVSVNNDTPSFLISDLTYPSATQVQVYFAVDCVVEFSASHNVDKCSKANKFVVVAETVDEVKVEVVSDCDEINVNSAKLRIIKVCKQLKRHLEQRLHNAQKQTSEGDDFAPRRSRHVSKAKLVDSDGDTWIECLIDNVKDRKRKTNKSRSLFFSTKTQRGK